MDLLVVGGSVVVDYEGGHYSVAGLVDDYWFPLSDLFEHLGWRVHSIAGFRSPVDSG